MKILLHTTLIVRESYPFLEEWLEYHTNLGVTRFVLYDNTGSRQLGKWQHGNCIAINGKNKYGIDIASGTALASDNDVMALREELAGKYNITWITWQPRDPETGEICYGQKDAYMDAIYNHLDDCDWALNIDPDEFLKIPGDNIPRFLSGVDSGVTVICFIDQERYLNYFIQQSKGMPVESTGLIGSMETQNCQVHRLGYKRIVKSSAVSRLKMTDAPQHNAYDPETETLYLSYAEGAYLRHFNQPR